MAGRMGSVNGKMGRGSNALFELPVVSKPPHHDNGDDVHQAGIDQVVHGTTLRNERHAK